MRKENFQRIIGGTIRHTFLDNKIEKFEKFVKGWKLSKEEKEKLLKAKEDMGKKKNIYNL